MGWPCRSFRARLDQPAQQRQTSRARLRGQVQRRTPRPRFRQPVQRRRPLALVCPPRALVCRHVSERRRARQRRRPSSEPAPPSRMPARLCSARGRRSSRKKTHLPRREPLPPSRSTPERHRAPAPSQQRVPRHPSQSRLPRHPPGSLSSVLRILVQAPLPHQPTEPRRRRKLRTRRSRPAGRPRPRLPRQKPWMQLRRPVQHHPQPASQHLRAERQCWRPRRLQPAWRRHPMLRTLIQRPVQRRML
mmetsp:Transcript_11288/g.39970  ORF Transcript_11288/g.39970 Transcript_11288/m.39970 type:complete len:247 (+) Transcript_11288:594-1334(+)